MKEYFYLEGHRSKSDYGEEDTLILDDSQAYASEEKAVAQAKEYFAADQDLSLIVIYRGLKLGDKYGIKYIFRNQDGMLEEVDNWWSDLSSC